MTLVSVSPASCFRNFTSSRLPLRAELAGLGVKVTDEVIAIFNDMKVRKAQAKRSCWETWAPPVTDPYQHFVKMLPPDDCRYALYDATYETKRNQEGGSGLHLLGSRDSKDALKRKFEGIKHEWQLGGSSVISLEGAPI
ncbi:hypothetical protein KUCAC02_004779 [Chaenocephalus aceratus]|uniref:Uncharacterized protein n=1 Tax=Chaenocephalus aceratus TaxID=36190 RepID=A0ACB9X1G6_CHAAC|nr:hypothetical protein KUCAC02_004779 [Chaenocephalus aceratus]